MPAKQPAITDWLADELTKKLATLPSDNARYRHLILCWNAWQVRYQRFAEFGEQPFNEPHPVYGDMIALDFANLLADIDRRKTMLESKRVPA